MSLNDVGVICSALILVAMGCGRKEVKPVDIFPEDNCSNCRMAVSERAFASEIIVESGEVMKFDDLACLEQFRRKNPDLNIDEIFVTDHETGQWLPYKKSVVVKTGLQTPMGSGKIAVADSNRARAVAVQYPPAQDPSEAQVPVAAGRLR
ncbi:MAG: nitrous oxide reductase accessory protein NosL [Ignavibacteria bacterium]|nr:nitrous oxide reductase accessory protein NosL [Ignavibacteria bacterium]